MKRLTQPVTPSTSLMKWFVHELERRDIDVDIHAKYTIALVQDAECCSECISGPNCSFKDTLDPIIDDQKRVNDDQKRGIDAHWNYSPNREIAIEMLQSASNSDQNVAIDVLIDQLREKLVRFEMSPEPCPDYRGDIVNGNLKNDESLDIKNLERNLKNDESLDIKNLESKFEQLAVLWMQSDRCPSVDNNRSIWSYGSTSSDSGPPSPRVQIQSTFSDLFRTAEEDGVRTLCPVEGSSIWGRSDRNIVDDWLNRGIEAGHPWMKQRKCSLDNHLSTSLFKEVTSKRSDTQVAGSYDHLLPNVPDVQVFDENLLTSHKTHFQPIKNDSWQRELSVVIDPDRKGLVPCSPLCPNRVLANRVNSVESKKIEPRPSSVSSKELASFMDPGCPVHAEEDPIEGNTGCPVHAEEDPIEGNTGCPVHPEEDPIEGNTGCPVHAEEDQIEGNIVIEEDDVKKEMFPIPHSVVKSVVIVEDVIAEDGSVRDEDVIAEDGSVSDERDEYEAIESILNQVLNNRSVEPDYDEYPPIVQLDPPIVHLDVQVEDVATNDTYPNMPWMNEDLNSQIMTAETVYLTDDSDDYFLHPTSDVDSSLSDFYNDPALLFVYNRPAGGLPSTTTTVGQYSKPCSFFLEGNCRKSDCKYSHDFKSIQCKFWLEGSCFKGDSCPFLHSDLPPMIGGPCDEPSPPLKDFSMNDMDFPSLAVESSNVGTLSQTSSSSCRERDTIHKVKSKSSWIVGGNNLGTSARTRTMSRESPTPVPFRLQVGRKKRKKGASHPKGV